jgi:ABC-2 type transport system permease protein
VVVDTELSPELSTTMSILAQQLALEAEIAALGGDPAQVAQTVAAAAPVVVSLEPADAVDAGSMFAGVIVGILIFIAVVTTGQLVAQGVVEEKTSRVVEILLATIRPWQLKAGKVTGIGAVGLLQLLIVVGAAAVTAAATGGLSGTDVNLTSTAVWALVWFVLGFVMYSLVLAALAALVSRQEDVSSVITPVIVIMTIPYLIGVTVAPQDPTSPLVVNLSMVPFFAPFLMPIRIAMGSVPAWQVAGSTALTLAVIPLLVWVAGRIYGNAVLRTGARVPIREALRRG